MNARAEARDAQVAELLKKIDHLTTNQLAE